MINFAALQITANSQNLREYASSNQTSGIHGTLCERAVKVPYWVFHSIP